MKRAAQLVAERALGRFGRIASFINNATEYASRGVRVNVVAPGVRVAAYDAASYEGIAGPIGQISGSATSFDAILYLEQATLVTGETLRVDGGQAAGH